MTTTEDKFANCKMILTGKTETKCGTLFQSLVFYSLRNLPTLFFVR